ncbi:MAG: RNB domain-containing ribonuclease [Clostridia bacterium]|nr:RNB domain-containing ribonuclease [Clostridia bacterium]
MDNIYLLKNETRNNGRERPKFSREALYQAGCIEKINPDSLIETRRDMRYRTVLSFASDADSASQYALSVTKDGDVYHLAVNVADVAALISPDTELDLAARERFAAVGTGSGSSGMLPESLVRGVFNLREGEDRLTVSLFIDVNENGEVSSSVIDKSVTRVSRRCLFGELDALRINADASEVTALRRKYSQFMPMIDDMYGLAAALFRLRCERGGIRIDAFDRVYETGENGEVTGLKQVQQPDSKAMWTEIMMFASVQAGKMMRERGLPAVFYSQDPPPEKKVAVLARAFGLDPYPELPPVERIARIVDRSRGSEFHALLCDELKLLSPCCKYTSCPAFDAENACDTVIRFGHPATRYTDLVSHRALACMIKDERSGIIDPEAIKLDAEDYAAMAQKAAEQRYKAERAFDKSRREALLKPGDEVFGWVLDRKKREALLIGNVHAHITGEKAIEQGKKLRFRIVSAGKTFEAELIG